MKVLIVVTHLLGTGHLRRALTLARAFAEAGHPVTLASGGMPVAGLDLGKIRLEQLPPLRSDGTDFTRLLDENGDPAGLGALAARQAALLRLFDAMAPDILITELFPFGRRILSAEFLTLLDAARNAPRPPLVLSSIRDILAPPSKPEKAARAEEIVAQFYDAVLVHSDPQITPLEISWPVSETLSPRLRYTGFVAPPAAGPHPDRAGAGEVLVSAGGGSVGDTLFRTAIATARQTPRQCWRLLVGGADPVRIAELQALAAGTPAVVEPARPDFRQMLYHAAASVSMCGYNTAMDLMQAGTPAVLVPFDAGNEVEQGLRAQSLAHLAGIAVLQNADLSADRLAETVATVTAQPRRDRATGGFDGAAETVRIAVNMAEDR